MTDRKKLIEIVKNSLIKHIDKSCCLAENIIDDLLTEDVTTLPVAFSDNRRERMIELLDGYYEEIGSAHVHYFTDDESEMLADYILADGWIKPQCKVGQPVWFIRNGKIIETIVEKIVLKEKGLYLKLECNAMYETSCNSIGKTVFFDPKEAEKSLKK